MITGRNLEFGDDQSAQITSPFPVRFGGGSFTNLFVSSNGNVNFTEHFASFANEPIPTAAVNTLVAPLKSGHIY
jgi:hypothetical protein